MHRVNRPWPRLLKGFIVLEGLDGSGTTTQLNILKESFAEGYTPGFFTCEPTEGEIGKIIRKVLGGSMPADPFTLAYLFAADRNHHLTDPEDGILKHLAMGETVITDRYFFSSLAYQSLGCGYDFVLNLNGVFPLPEHCIFLDVPAPLCQKRITLRNGREIFDNVSTQEEILCLYEKAFGEFSNTKMKIHKIDGTLPKEKIAEKIWKALF